MKGGSKMKYFTQDGSGLFKGTKLIGLVSTLLLISFIIIPFDDLPYLTFLSGLGRRAALYPFFIIIPLIALLTIKNLRIYFKFNIEKIIFIAFYFWIVLGVYVNIYNILESSFKGSSGIGKAIIQIVTLTFVILASYCTEIILSTRKITLKNIRMAILLSLIPVIIVGLIELINIMKVYDTSEILKKITNIINIHYKGNVYKERTRGVSAEASYLGMYCAFIFPWILSYLYTEKEKVKKIIFGFISLVILLLVITTKSRTATILILFELVAFVGLVVLFYSNLKVKIYSIILVLALGLSLVIYPKMIANITNYSSRIHSEDLNGDSNINNESEIGKEIENEYSVGSMVSSVSDQGNLSNMARFTMQNAALGIGKDNPIFGVGLGQFAFNFSSYVQEESLKSSEVRNWLDSNIDIWPPVHSLYHRLIAETGFVGLALYIAFIFIVCLKLLIKIIKDKKDIIGMLLLVSYCSIIISSMTIDTFLLTQFWLMTPIITLYTNRKIAIS